MITRRLKAIINYGIEELETASVVYYLPSVYGILSPNDLLQGIKLPLGIVDFHCYGFHCLYSFHDCRVVIMSRLNRIETSVLCQIT
jgi:hypothetical protein